MRLLVAAQDDFARHRGKKKRIGFDVENHARRGMPRQLIEETIKRLALLASIPGACDCLDRRAMRRNPWVQSGFTAQIQ